MDPSGDLQLWRYFQAKVYYLIKFIENFKTYIDNIQVLRKDIFTKNVGQKRIIFDEL